GSNRGSLLALFVAFALGWSIRRARRSHWENFASRNAVCRDFWRQAWRKESVMLHKAKELIGDAIAATDGPIGVVDEIYFDDQRWGVRYFVVNTGGWLAGRKVLISPVSIDSARSSEKALSVALSRKQIEQSPSVDSDKPVSRQYEEIFARYYGYPYYWADMAF